MAFIATGARAFRNVGSSEPGKEIWREILPAAEIATVRAADLCDKDGRTFEGRADEAAGQPVFYKPAADEPAIVVHSADAKAHGA